MRRGRLYIDKRGRKKIIPRLKPVWCVCNKSHPSEWIYMDDGECSCGIWRHHYHCPKCGGVTQVG